MAKTFPVTSQGTYLSGRISNMGVFSHYHKKGEEIIFYSYENRGDFALAKSIFQRLYIKSGNQEAFHRHSCIGIYESEKRHRVVPFLTASSPQGDEAFVAFYEIISGRAYALSVHEFLEQFALDILYPSHNPL